MLGGHDGDVPVARFRLGGTAGRKPGNLTMSSDSWMTPQGPPITPVAGTTIPRTDETPTAIHDTIGDTSSNSTEPPVSLMNHDRVRPLAIGVERTGGKSCAADCAAAPATHPTQKAAWIHRIGIVRSTAGATR
jgi:hypothetical protein